MKKLRYIGWRPDLKGKTALSRDPHKAGRVLVQFDSFLGPVEDTEVNGLCYGWHDFAADQFEVIPDPPA